MRTRSRLAPAAICLALAAGALLARPSPGKEEPASARVGAVLDAFHAAAASADGDRYFGLLTEDAVFLGTDATERWDKPAFQAFATPYFDKGRGWTYTSRRRHVRIDPGGRIAWFDELLDNEHYGTCRGSGVLRHTDAGWRVAHYDLSIPIPNPLAREVVDRIRAHEANRPATRTVYVVRHAEKEAGAGDDPTLTDTGRDRARRLARMLRSQDLVAVYATQYRRTQETVAPAAASAGLEVTHYGGRETKRLAKTIRALEKPGAVLVAGHSNTVPQFLRDLGADTDVTIAESDYDNLFVATLRAGTKADLLHVHQGD